MGSKNSIPARQGTIAAQWPAGFALLPATSVSNTTTYHSQAFNASNLDNLGLQVSFTGTMVGTLSVECSIDNLNWIALTFSPVLSQPNGSALSYLIGLNQLPYPYLRVTYVNSSGSGTLTVFLSGKDLN